jgi:hypothetical protein
VTTYSVQVGDEVYVHPAVAVECRDAAVLLEAIRLGRVYVRGHLVMKRWRTPTGAWTSATFHTAPAWVRWSAR